MKGKEKELVGDCLLSTESKTWRHGKHKMRTSRLVTAVLYEFFFKCLAMSAYWSGRKTSHVR